MLMCVSTHRHVFYAHINLCLCVYIVCSFVRVHMHLPVYLQVSVHVCPPPFLWKSNAAAATSLHIPPVLTPFNQLCA